MKNILIFVTIILVTSCKAQIYPLNTSPSDVPDNGYIKDINNELDKYIGLWKGTWSGKTVYLELKKNKKYYSGTNSYYIDEIVGERKIIAQNGQIEIDRISNFDLLHPEFWGITKSLKYPGKYKLSFFPKNMCRLHNDINITSFTGTQMTLQMPALMMGRAEDNCIHAAYVQQNGEYPVNFPKDIILTKQ